MTWITCPRNIENHHCPNEELGEWLEDTPMFQFGRPDPAECSGACGGEIDVDEYDDDPSPPGVGLSPGSYHIVEVPRQTCKCELTEKEFESCVERARGAYEDRLEDYYEERARAYVDGFNY